VLNFSDGRLKDIDLRGGLGRRISRKKVVASTGYSRGKLTNRGGACRRPFTGVENGRFVKGTAKEIGKDH